MSLTVDSIIQSLMPDMADYADNSLFYHWMDYACELDEITLVNYRDENLVEYLNKRIEKYPSAHAVNHACTDLAITLESLLPNTYKGVFKYV